MFKYIPLWNCLAGVPTNYMAISIHCSVNLFFFLYLSLVFKKSIVKNIWIVSLVYVVS